MKTHARIGPKLRSRLRRAWVIKSVGISLFTTVFFAAYFHVLNHPVHPVTEMPTTALDAAIPFQPIALIPYASLWIYVSLAPGLLTTWRQLAGYALAAASLAATGLAIFHYWPTAVPASAMDASTTPALAFLKEIDASGNACPSLHVAFAVFTALRVRVSLVDLNAAPLWHASNFLWATLITYSTLATKQHVALDALAGAALGAVVAGFYSALGRSQRPRAGSGNTVA